MRRMLLIIAPAEKFFNRRVMEYSPQTACQGEKKSGKLPDFLKTGGALDVFCELPLFFMSSIS